MSAEIITYGDLEKSVEDGNEKAILKLVTKVTALAKTGAPVDTGQLRGSIMGKVVGKEYGHQEGPQLSVAPKKFEGYVGSALLHAIYNEFGTRRMPAQPFLRPAVNSVANGGSARAEVVKAQEESVAMGMKKGPRKKKVIK